MALHSYLIAVGAVGTDDDFVFAVVSAQIHIRRVYQSCHHTCDIGRESISAPPVGLGIAVGREVNVFLIASGWLDDASEGYATEILVRYSNLAVGSNLLAVVYKYAIAIGIRHSTPVRGEAA